MRKTLVFMLGVGGTGKTVLAEAYFKHYPENAFRVPSPIRKFFGTLGLSSEAAPSMSNEAYSTLQHTLALMQERFIVDTVAEYQTSKFDTLVFERSLTCHYSYCMYHNQRVGLNIYEGYISELVDHYRAFLNAGFAVLLVHLPYLMPWLKTGATYDSFRDVQFHKDFLVSLVADHYFTHLTKTFSSERNFHTLVLPHSLSSDTRAELLRDCVIAVRTT